MRLAAYAALLAVAHGTAQAARSDWGGDNPGGAGNIGGAAGGGNGKLANPYAQYPNATDADVRRMLRDAQDRASRSSGGCGCQGPGGMHAGPI